MDTAAIFAIIEKGLTLIPLLIQAGMSIDKTISNLTTLSQAAQAGGVTDEQLAAIEADLDADLAAFNESMD